MGKDKETVDKKRRVKPLVLVCTLALAVGTVAGGTIAWLIAESDEVVNTFTYGDIDLRLEETELDENGDPTGQKTAEGNEYKMVPGEKYVKDPEVTVVKDSEPCWLFVKLVEDGSATITDSAGNEKTYGFDDFLSYEIADGWTLLVDNGGKEIKGVYYRKVEADEADQSFYVLKGAEDAESNDPKRNGVITVNDTVTKDMLNALDESGADTENATYPKLSITSYAVQYSGFESDENGDGTAAANAWQAVQSQTSTNS